MTPKKDEKKLGFPQSLVAPIKAFLEGEIVKLKRQQKKIRRDDPFSDDTRTTDNSLEEDVDEQIGHFDAEVKAGFVKRQIVQLRKALTMIKIGKYGICEKCGKMIDTDRLAIKPEATTCVDCTKAMDE